MTVSAHAYCPHESRCLELLNALRRGDEACVEAALLRIMLSFTREGLWQIAHNVPEHDGTTDTSYEEWARPFAAAMLAVLTLYESARIGAGE